MSKEIKDVSRTGGSNDNDVLVEGSKMGGLGAVIPEMLSGIQSLEASDVVSPMVGGGGAVLGTVAAQKWGGKISPKIPEMAPLAGAVAGMLASVPLMWWKGSSAAIQGMITSGLVGLSLYAVPKIQNMMAMSGVVVRPYGLFEAQQVRGLPQVTDSGHLPASAAQQMDPAVYGQVP